MRFAKVRLILAVLALFVWVGYIAYQAIAFGRFPVVSRSQLLVAKLVVAAEVNASSDGKPETTVVVNDVLRPASKKDLIGQKIMIPDLNDPAMKGFQRETKTYILPLVGGEGGRYSIAPLPTSPNFESADLLIYPDEPLVRKQLTEILKSE
jgi:hypothetical protein